MKSSVDILLTISVLTSLVGIGGFAPFETDQSTQGRSGFAQFDTPWWADDSGSYESDTPWQTEDSNSYPSDTPWWADDTTTNESDTPWWAEDSNTDETDTPWWADDSGSSPSNTPWWANSSCSGNNCDHDRVWWQEGSECFGSLCDNPWNGTTSDCSFGICDDNSFLVDCSFVTVSALGAEGACESQMGQTRFNSCFPVSGSGTLSGQDQQTFRCSNTPSYQTGGYPLTDVATASDANVVHVLCTEGSMANQVGPNSCIDAPRGIKYYTCQKDHRFYGPIGTNQEWFICEQ